MHKPQAPTPGYVLAGSNCISIPASLHNARINPANMPCAPHTPQPAAMAQKRGNTSKGCAGKQYHTRGAPRLRDIHVVYCCTLSKATVGLISSSMLCRIDTPAPSQKVPSAETRAQKYTDFPGVERRRLNQGRHPMRETTISSCPAQRYLVLSEPPPSSTKSALVLLVPAVSGRLKLFNSAEVTRIEHWYM